MTTKAFNLSISNDDKRNEIDQAIALEAEGTKHNLGRKVLRLKKKAPTWSKQAKKSADELLKHFIQTL